MYYMTFVDTENKQEIRTRLSRYVNVEDKLYIEMCDDDNPEDLYRMQTTTLNKEDLVALIKELQRLLPDVK